MEFNNSTGCVLIKKVCGNCKNYTMANKLCKKHNTNEPAFCHCAFWIPNTCKLPYKMILKYPLEK